MAASGNKPFDNQNLKFCSDQVSQLFEPAAVLLALEERGWLQIEPGNRLSLTDVGLREYGSILATAELKKTRKAHRITAELNKQEITRRKAASKEVHDSLEVTLGELAFLLGRTWKKEHELARGRVITDVVWYGESRKMTHAFEVQHRGEWKNAIGNLETVRRYYPDCKLFLVVHNEGEIRTIRDLLGAQKNESIRILRVSDLQALLTTLRRLPKDNRQDIMTLFCP